MQNLQIRWELLSIAANSWTFVVPVVETVTVVCENNIRTRLTLTDSGKLVLGNGYTAYSESVILYS